MTPTTAPRRLLHLVFKTHLDIGFTDLASKVVDRYLGEYIPRAIALAQQMRDEARDEGFVWTAGSWIIWEYLERASAAGRRSMERAIAAGDIVWHGLPFTTHSEIMEPSLFEYGLSLSRRLDARFNRRTIAAKMTDVPGHTRAIVPLLARAGIRFLHIGVNPACTFPAVPPVFVWRDEPSGSQVMVMYHTDYGDTTFLPGLDHGLSICFTGDNHGPQTREALQQQYADLRQRHPGWTLRASTLDAYAEKLATIENRLPVVTEEIADTWIHGTGSDPAKVAAFRQLCRLRVQWLSKRASASARAPFDDFSRNLLLVAEHTWGLDNKTHLADLTHYATAAFAAVRNRSNHTRMEQSWREQRAYLHRAVKALPSPALQAEARRQLRALRPTARRLAGARQHHGAATLENQRLSLTVDPVTGAVCRLHDRRHDHTWCDKRHPLFVLRYEAFGLECHRRFLDQYLRVRPRWAELDFGRKGLGRALKGHHTSSPTVRRIEQDGTRCVRIELAGDEVSCGRFGSPRRWTLELTLADDEPRVQVTVQWFDKAATRVPEATWLSLRPRVSAETTCLLHKLGSRINPLDVIRNGNRSLHGVWGGISYQTHHRNLHLHTLDAGLIAVGKPRLLDFCNTQPRLTDGLHVNLHNSTFNTNFPLWYEDDARFRFELILT